MSAEGTEEMEGEGGGGERIATSSPHTIEQNKFQMDEPENVKTMK